MITSIYDRVIMLKSGRVIAEGNQKKVINNKNLNKLYGINLEVVKKNEFWTIKRLSK